MRIVLSKSDSPAFSFPNQHRKTPVWILIAALYAKLRISGTTSSSCTCFKTRRNTTQTQVESRIYLFSCILKKKRFNRDGHFLTTNELKGARTSVLPKVKSVFIGVEGNSFTFWLRFNCCFSAISEQETKFSTRELYR